MSGMRHFNEKPRILVVDDDSDVRQLITHVARRAGYEAASAATVKQGSQEIQEGNLKLVILDLIMPGEDGIECLKILADSPAIQDTPVLVSSGYDRGMVEVAKKLGTGLGLNMVGELPKPFKVSDLETRLDEILSGKPDRGRTGGAPDGSPTAIGDIVGKGPQQTL